MELYLGTSVASKTPLVRAAHVGSPSVAKGKVQDISATLLGERFGGWMNIWTLPSLKLTAILHLKMDGWNTIVSFARWPIFRCELLVLGSVILDEMNRWDI